MQETASLKTLLTLMERKEFLDEVLQSLKERYEADVERARNHRRDASGRSLEDQIAAERDRLLKILEETRSTALFDDFGVAEVRDRTEIVIHDEASLVKRLLECFPDLVEQRVRKARFNSFARGAGWVDEGLDEFFSVRHIPTLYFYPREDEP